MKNNLLIFLIATLMISSCATGNHGTFVTSTHIEPENNYENKFVGKVNGESSQTWFLYVFPIGESPSTDKAISNAKAKIHGTKYLTDISVDDRTYWEFGYSKQVIKVEANAYKQKTT